ncbi:hypothetical protein F0726_02345 [Acidithiobacillus caldus]|nr:hypothetical protein F0726_02345 [Acidithiobacillus caldus]
MALSKIMLNTKNECPQSVWIPPFRVVVRE